MKRSNTEEPKQKYRIGTVSYELLNYLCVCVCVCLFVSVYVCVCVGWSGGCLEIELNGYE